MKTLYIMRGYPGSGKSFYANKLSESNGAVICSSDSYFMENGIYNFNINKLGANHQKCYTKFVETVCLRKDVIIDNTNAKINDIKKYVSFIELLRKETSEQYKVKIISVKHNDVESAIALRNEQPDNKNVPSEIIKNMNDTIINNPESELIKNYPELFFEFETIT